MEPEKGYLMVNPHASPLTDPHKRLFMMRLISAIITFSLRSLNDSLRNHKPRLIDVYPYFPKFDDDDDLDARSFYAWLNQQQQRQQLDTFLEKFTEYLQTLDHQCTQALARLASAAVDNADIAATHDVIAAAIRELHQPLAIAQLAQMLVGHPSAAMLNQGVHPALQNEVREAHQELVAARAAERSSSRAPFAPTTRFTPKHAMAPTSEFTFEDVHEAFHNFVAKYHQQALEHRHAGNALDAVIASSQARFYRTVGVHFNRCRDQHHEQVIGNVAASDFMLTESLCYGEQAAARSGLVEVLSLGGRHSHSIVAYAARHTVFGESNYSSANAFSPRPVAHTSVVSNDSAAKRIYNRSIA